MESLKKFTTNIINRVYRKLMCSPVLQAINDIICLINPVQKKPRPADNLRKYKRKQNPKNKVMLQFKI